MSGITGEKVMAEADEKGRFARQVRTATVPGNWKSVTVCPTV